MIKSEVHKFLNWKSRELHFVCVIHIRYPQINFYMHSKQDSKYGKMLGLDV